MATKKKRGRKTKTATKKRATSASTRQEDNALAAYLKEPNYTKLAKRFNMSPMGLRARFGRPSGRALS